MYHVVTQESEPDNTSDSPEPEPDEEQAKPKKERVLHTRIPAVLEQELKAAAKALRVPVSNLVRTILEDAVTLADKATGHFEDGLSRAVRSVHSERERLRTHIKRPNPLESVVAFQPVVIATARRCAACEAPLEPGANAALGVSDEPGPKIFVCNDCIPKPEAT